jgi:predicted component of type VI protein secretion system
MSPPTSRLIVRMGPNPGMIFDLTKEITTLGRDVANDIVLGDPEVSRQHSRLTRTPGGYVLEDLGSTNGTFVNGDRLTSPRVLNPGDLIGLSEKVTLTFEMASPETAETMLSQPSDTARAATVLESTPEPQETPSPPPPTPMASPMPSQFADEVEEVPRWRSPWVIAGCGCLVVVVVLGIILVYMDANYPDILYAPLRMLGF